MNNLEGTILFASLVTMFLTVGIAHSVMEGTMKAVWPWVSILAAVFLYLVLI